MKIGFDAKRIYHNTSGLGNYGRDLVRVLSEFYPHNTYNLYNPKPKKVKRLQPKENIFEILPETKFWRKFSSIWRQGPILHQLEKDGVQIFHGLTGELPGGVQNSKIKSVVTIHDLIFIRYPKLYSFFDRIIHLKKVKFSANNADKIIAISEQTKRDIVQYLKIDAAKIDVIYQGCHATFIEEKSTVFKREVKDKFKLPEKFILNVGALNERKNILSLIKAIENIDVPLIIIGGKTSYFKVLESYIKDNQLEKKVHFLENVSMPELSAIYQLASVFVYPSVFEGFGIPIIEALYSKTPVITSTGSCFSEAGGPDSMYVTPKDVEALSSKIQLVLYDERLANNMIEKGFKFVQKFNDDVIAEKYFSIYKNLLS
ncbi:glycosyltransferase family 4 protein [Polaribacter sp. Z014]|uniref:glycosyltransferase family 4 protein n=1 Tax=Polaribacter sp. Z014 TaxID=2927126 RepID=UPI0020221636|nr:glycosyltransferase family 1 protein [Polaribacter sp. Z014]MCL7763075.1 glycosyltransferase family 4 protein [Polaribacter sp. Z014]